MTQALDTAAPHGRDANGTPLAPYGLNVDGSPRKSNRGARAGQKGNGAGRKPSARRSAGPQMATSNLSDDERKQLLSELTDAFVVAPLAGLSTVPFLAKRIGPAQTDALAGDAFIISQYAPSVFDGAILLSKTKPSTLAWLDKIETNAPYLLLAQAGLSMAKALALNHLNPDARLASAGRSMAQVRMAQMAEAVNEAADEARAAMMERAAAERAFQEAA